MISHFLNAVVLYLSRCNRRLSQTRSSSTSSHHVRATFLDYFSGHASLPHFIARSTKVCPPSNDPTLPFVNAGMNAFKRVFLGQAKPPGCSVVEEKRAVANSQKVLILVWPDCSAKKHCCTYIFFFTHVNTVVGKRISFKAKGYYDGGLVVVGNPGFKSC